MFIFDNALASYISNKLCLKPLCEIHPPNKQNLLVNLINSKLINSRFQTKSPSGYCSSDTDTCPHYKARQVFRCISEDDWLMAILRREISGVSAGHEAAAFPLPAPAQRGDICDTNVHGGLAAVLLNPGIVPGGVGCWLPLQIKLFSDAVKKI